MSRRARVTRADCPQCGASLRANDAGAWCENYPCRFSVNRRKAAVQAAVAKSVWGDDVREDR